MDLPLATFSTGMVIDSAPVAINNTGLRNGAKSPDSTRNGKLVSITSRLGL